MHHIHNRNAGVVHLHNVKTGKRLTLNRGMNTVSDEDAKIHERMLKSMSGLEHLEALNDVAEAKKEEPKAVEAEVKSSEEAEEAPKKSRKAKKSEEVLENLSE